MVFGLELQHWLFLGLSLLAQPADFELAIYHNHMSQLLKINLSVNR